MLLLGVFHADGATDGGGPERSSRLTGLVLDALRPASR